jgi:ribosomal protein S18 acetylase RimI-like enzyme
MKANMIRNYQVKDEKQVIDLWNTIFPITDAHHDPQTSIQRKMAVDPELFLVAVEKNTIIGTAMGGYDGHRGWIYSVSVHPEYRKKGIGSELLRSIEAELMKRNCPKVNLQILETNEDVVEFYKKNGYFIEPRISMGKVIRS